ncbi:RNaseH domain-containing protein [Paenibacillus sp. V4I5]|uniref:RNaseH domain-containing protein n=1 Tax=Paenibacillus sp. V4I5 TaxID=3042306 RepID=UPI00278FAF5E|nr:RNaseH domain-containing protein [Paenibacillus sp. V4I5]MDQ0917544.1 hypothetical protein [Paenibacillus sp. V4I5]
MISDVKTKSSDTPILMEYALNPDKMEEIILEAIYLPDWLIAVLNPIVSVNGPWFKTLADFRLLTEACYSDVIFISFARDSLLGTRPFAYFSPGLPNYIKEVFIRKFAFFAGEGLNLILPDFDSESLKIEQTTLWESRKLRGLLSAYYAYSFSQKLNEKSQEGNNKSIWVRGCGTDSMYKTMQIPMVPSTFNGKGDIYSNQHGSLYINFYETDRETLLVSPSYSRYILSPLLNIDKNEFVYNAFPRQNNRSLWIYSPITERFFAVTIEKIKGSTNKSRIVQSNILKNLEEIDISIPVDKILEDPSLFYPNRSNLLAVIPYLPEDATRREHVLKNGVSYEELDIYKTYMDEYEELVRVTNLKIVEPQSSIKKKESLGGDGVQYPVFNTVTIPKMIIEVFSRNESIASFLRDVIHDTVPPEKYTQKMPYSYPKYTIFESSPNSYQYIDEDGILHFSVEFKIKEWKEELFGILPTSSSTIEKSIYERKQQILNSFQTTSDGFALIEIDPWHESKKNDEKARDPKSTIVSCLRSIGYHTQCFHKEENGAFHNRLLKSLYDLFVRVGATGHLANEFSEIWPNEPIYLPFYLYPQKHKKEYIPTLVAFKNGFIKVSLPGEGWMDLHEAVLLLGKESVLRKISKPSRDGLGGLIRSSIEANGLILTPSEYLWEVRNLESYRLISYTVGSDKVPIAYKISKRTKGPSAGNLLFEHCGTYYSIGTRIAKTPSLGTRDEKNEQYRRRATFEIQFHGIENEHERDTLAYVIHLMRHITLTFDPATNHPYPIHLSRYLQETLDAYN